VGIVPGHQNTTMPEFVNAHLCQKEKTKKNSLFNNLFNILRLDVEIGVNSKTLVNVTLSTNIFLCSWMTLCSLF
jgi:hypothetical protein